MNKVRNKKVAVCVISSAGGHLAQAIRATSALKGYPISYVTFYLPHIKKSLSDKECYFVEDPHTSPKKYFINFLQVLKLYLKKKPKIIVSTGAGIAVPMCIIGKLLGSKLIFIESGSRTIFPSRTGRTLYRLTDLFIVQWKSLLKFYPNAIYGGPLV